MFIPTFFRLKLLLGFPLFRSALAKLQDFFVDGV